MSGAIRLFLDRLRFDWVSDLLLVALVFVMALAAASAPRLFNRVADEGLRYEVGTASPVERNLQLGRITRIESVASDGMANVAAVERQIHAGLPESVRRVIGGESLFAESVNWTIPDSPPTRPGFLSLRFQGDLGQHVRLVEGRMPTGTTQRVPAPDPPEGSVDPAPDRQALVFETALSTRTAQELDVTVGDRIHLIPDTDDPLVGAFGIPEAAAVEVVGLYEVVDPADDFWLADYALDQPTLVPVGINVVLVYATGLLAPEAYPALLELGFDVRYTFRYYIDAQRLDAGMLDELGVDFGRMASQYASFASAPSPTRTTLQTGLPALVDRFRAERRASEAVLLTTAIGPVAVGLVAIGVVTVLAMERRRRSVILLRGRGGSAGQIAGSHLIEGLLLSVPPAAVAAWLVTLLVDGRGSPFTPFAAGLVAVATVLILVGALLPAAVSSLRSLERPQVASLRASPRRLSFEALAVVLAVGGVVLLRQRGLAGGSSVGDLAGVDPLLAAVPALVGLAVGIVTVRLYPLPVRLAGVVAAGGRGLIPSLGLRRAERQSGTGHLPLVVLLLTVAIGTFSSTMLATVDRGQVDASWRAVGAAHRITAASPMREELDLGAVDGVAAVATAHETNASVGVAGGTRVRLVAIDAPEYEAVTVSTPAETTFPQPFHHEVGDVRPGTTDAPIPAIVSRALARESTTPLSVGETFELTIQARFATFVVTEIRSEIPTLRADQPFIVVPRALLVAGLIDRPLGATSLFVRAPAAASDALAAVVESRSDVAVESQAGRLAALRERPLIQAVGTGFSLALLVAVAFATVAVTISLYLSGAGRARETAQLRTMGVRGGQIAGLAILEHAPAIVVAVIGGLVLGVAVGWVVLPGLGLAAFVGAAADPVLRVDLLQLAVLTGALAAVVGAGIVLAASAQRRADPARSVRSGAE